MHLLRRFGHTIDDIRRDGHPIAARIPMQRGDGSATDQAEGLARGVAAIARFFERSRTERAVVLGDRIEALAAAFAAVATGRTLVHIHGGDVAPGDFDDRLRAAITQLADLHLPATQAAARRVIAMGANRARVHVVGAPGLDDVFQLRESLPRRRALAPRAARARIARRAPLVPAPSRTALIIQHAHGRSDSTEQRVMRDLLRAVASRGLCRTIIFPNSDRGHRGVLRAIDAHLRESPAGEVDVHRSLPRERFLRALVDAELLVGNSSCGLIEAPVVGTPSINVGDRQRGREPGGPGVFHAGESYAAIAAAIDDALPGKRARRCFRRGPYGRGGAGARIARWVLATLGRT